MYSAVQLVLNIVGDKKCFLSTKLEEILTYYVILKTVVIVLNIQLYHHRSKFNFKIF